jgi:hypothetical protein
VVDRSERNGHPGRAFPQGAGVHTGKRFRRNDFFRVYAGAGAWGRGFWPIEADGSVRRGLGDQRGRERRKGRLRARGDVA